MSDFSLEMVSDVLSLTIGEKSMKVRVPKGERGVAGRDGVSIRGDKGEKGDQGISGKDGRDSCVPGPVGPEGPQGLRGEMPQFEIGKVIVGETAEVILSGTKEHPCLNFTIPRGFPGVAGIKGKDGQHGTHEYISCKSMGHCPSFNNEFLASYVIADGVMTLPEMTMDDLGKWTHIKTFDKMHIAGLVEGAINLDREGRRFIVIHHNDSFKFTAF
jgi:hypothetical protein